MSRYLQYFVAALLVLASTAALTMAADTPAVVKVALLDMSSVMPPSMMGPRWGQGQGMINPGMEGQGMMGQGMMGGMMSVRVDVTSVKAGTVKFDVTNWSRSVVHGMQIIPVESPTALLPYDYSQARVPESQVRVLGETADLRPNNSKTFEVALAPGSYLLICNLPGHYAEGMAASFTVTP